MLARSAAMITQVCPLASLATWSSTLLMSVLEEAAARGPLPGVRVVGPLQAAAERVVVDIVRINQMKGRAGVERDAVGIQHRTAGAAGPRAASRRSRHSACLPANPRQSQSLRPGRSPALHLSAAARPVPLAPSASSSMVQTRAGFELRFLPPTVASFAFIILLDFPQPPFSHIAPTATIGVSEGFYSRQSSGVHPGRNRGTRNGATDGGAINARAGALA